MPNLRDIRRRIRSVRNTQQVTRAMKIVAAARLRRAQERILATRPYAIQMNEVLSSLASRANPESHPLLADRGEERVELIVVTADKGFCGGFNTNIIKRAQQFLRENGDRVKSLHLVGKKGADHFGKLGYEISGRHIDVFRKVEYSHAARIAGHVIERFLGGSLDAVHVVYNQFKSVIQQQVVVERLLPIERLESKEPPQDYIYEPGPLELFDRLLPRHVEYKVLRALLESAAAEFAARMSAMDTATRNAGDLIQELTLNMNRVRQASITSEIIEVVSGAQAQTAI
ncbi:MAG TPA: ATP synthase F1 subunit gamma [Candidatus Saccharimonadales bacterium]|nr:ATP synthase F1 subunit gamma [Candidatus Saccharimonadales bacterium]